MKLKEIIKTEPGNINKAVSDMAANSAANLSKFYLLESDPYFYLHLTKNLLSYGKLSDTQKNGRYLDKLMMAPFGFWRYVELHPYIGAITYKLLAFFDKNISLVTATALVPLIFYALSVIVFVALCNTLNIPKFIIFISGIFFALSPIFIERSSFGWYDTDPYNILLQVLESQKLKH